MSSFSMICSCLCGGSSGEWAAIQPPLTRLSAGAPLKGSLCGRIWNPPLRQPKILTPEGPDGEKSKSVKKRAALLHVLAFCFLDHLFGVPRGEQPLGRGSLPRNSETFFASFFGHKKGRTTGSMTSPLSAPPQGGGKRKCGNNPATPHPLRGSSPRGEPLIVAHQKDL